MSFGVWWFPVGCVGLIHFVIVHRGLQYVVSLGVSYSGQSFLPRDNYTRSQFGGGGEIPECDLTGRRVMVDALPVRLHSGIDGFCLPWQRCTSVPAPTMSSSKTSILVNVRTQCSQCSCSCVETLVILRAKFHVVTSLLSNFDASVPVPHALPENETTVKVLLKWASFVVIMLLRDLAHIQSQIKPWLLFGKSFTLSLTIV